uniref:Mitochondrial ribosomal protein S27 n=1 Tax=Salvator merianae TaxID=96440 RepID=A0A8D0BGZ6_SALMN
KDRLFRRGCPIDDRFRHSPNCFYLRDWSIHSWIRQCLKFGAQDKALYTVQNKVQYGIFPDDFTFNLLLDSFIKDGNYEDAVAVVTEIMIQESFEQLSTQLLSLYVMYKYLAAKSELTVILSALNEVETHIVAHLITGKVELNKGLRAVYHQMPLMWTPGYLNRAVQVMENVALLPSDVKLCKEAIDTLAAILKPIHVADSSQEDPKVSKETSKQIEWEESEASRLPEYLNRFMDLISKLQSLGKIESANLLTLTTQLVKEKQPAFEAEDIAKYKQKLEDWEQERTLLVEREAELREKAKQELMSRTTAKASV